jgi:hypothetical protein
MPFIRQIAASLVFLSVGSLSIAQERKRPWLGAVVGAPVTEDIQASSGPVLPYSGEVRRSLDFPFAVGVRIETPVAGRLSFQVDGLYRRLRYPDDPSVVVTWEIPVLAKYVLVPRRFSPFLEAGPPFRATGNLNFSNPSHYGVSLGGGCDHRLKWLKIAPGIRYTRWAADGRPRTYPPTLTRQNQVELLVGFSF